MQTVEETEKVIETEASQFLVKANSFLIKTDEQRGEAVSFVKFLKERKTRIEEDYHFTKNKQDAYKTYEGALDTEKKIYGPFDEAIKVTNTTVKQFDTQEAIKVQMAAQEAEAKRQEQERLEREKILEKARKAEEKGKVEKAEVLREQAETVSVQPTFVPTQAVKKLVWKAKVNNLFLVCQAIAKGQIPFSVVEIRVSALNDFAKGYDGKTKIDGIEFYQESNSRI